MHSLTPTGWGWEGGGWCLKGWGHRASIWHSIAWAEAMLQIWTMEVLLSRTLLWGAECLQMDTSFCVGWTVNPAPPPHPAPAPPSAPPCFRNWKPSCIQTVWLRWLPHTHSLLKGLQSEVAYLKWHFGREKQKRGICRPSIMMEFWMQRRKWKVLEADTDVVIILYM